ncbi:hypothetical protein SKAU_G00401880 [Synaphobranchus kaupii]|uniref:Uncharacterized protein n=1 Tax=Synaphobranchus kaupii TaxID=118154 RepID=A0A9Q1E961_SYNKA|nr:hypothetical protein SKAU_G00401880 [Synaphobranchus kaupii]
MGEGKTPTPASAGVWGCRNDAPVGPAAIVCRLQAMGARRTPRKPQIRAPASRGTGSPDPPAAITAGGGGRGTLKLSGGCLQGVRSTFSRR